MNKFAFQLIVGILTIISCMPFKMLYVFSDMMYIIIRYVIRYRQRIIYNNISNSFPEYSKKECRRVEKAYYHHLCDLIVESMKLLHISDEELARRVEVRGGDMIERISADGRSVIVMLGHYGNWEWVQEVTKHYSHPKINAEIYRPLRSKISDELMKRIRGRFNTMLIKQKHAVRTLLRMNRDGQQFLVGFIADQRPNSKNLYNWTSFLNQETAFSTGAEEIGTRIGAHFVYLEVDKLRRGYYVMTFKNIAPQDCHSCDYPYTRKFMIMMEQTIRNKPEYWLWSHNRWRFKRNN